MIKLITNDASRTVKYGYQSQLSRFFYLRPQSGTLHSLLQQNDTIMFRLRLMRKQLLTYDAKMA